jgi:hypothetical protein
MKNMTQSPIKKFATDARPFLRLIEDGVNRVSGNPVDNRPDKPIDPKWTDQQTLDQLLWRIKDTASVIQSVPTPAVAAATTPTTVATVVTAPVQHGSTLL